MDVRWIAASKIQAAFRGFAVRKRIYWDVRNAYVETVRKLEGSQIEVIFPNTFPSRSIPYFVPKSSVPLPEPIIESIPLEALREVVDEVVQSSRENSMNVVGWEDAEMELDVRELGLVSEEKSVDVDDFTHTREYDFNPLEIVDQEEEEEQIRTPPRSHPYDRSLEELIRAPADVTSLTNVEKRRLELELELMLAKEAARARQRFLHSVQKHHPTSPL